MSHVHDALSQASSGDIAALQALGLARLQGVLSAEDEAALTAGIARVHLPPVTRLDGLALAACPTARHTTPRLVEASALPDSLHARFLRLPAPTDHLLLVHVDPEELHFRSFENILPLDRLFADLDGPVSLAGLERVASRELYRLNLSAEPALLARLQQLDALDLYVPPLNHASRGGQRFIFHSSHLARMLTGAVRAALPPEVVRDLSHVNPVFRCNRFEPHDPPFEAHLDTPYFDAAHQHISRYTLLLYLTGGRGEPALSVDGVEMCELPALSCVIFDQRYAHAGAAYVEGRKVFLRTELVSRGTATHRSPDIGALFATATYLTRTAGPDARLSRYSHDCYNRVAAAHWSGQLGAPPPEEPFLHKVFRGVHFLTNGHDLWLRDSAVSVREAAALAIFDFFNVAIAGQAFETLCRREAPRWGPGTAWIPGFLDGLPDPEEPLLVDADKGWFFPPPEEPNPESFWMHYGEHYFDDPSDSPPEVVRYSGSLDLLRRARRLVRRHIAPSPVLIMGQALFLDPSRFVVTDSHIHVLSDQRLQPVNFANFWSPSDNLVVDGVIDAPRLLVPPILYTRHDGCLHLMLDFFGNDWMVDSTPLQVAIPSLQDYPPAASRSWRRTMADHLSPDWEDEE